MSLLWLAAGLELFLVPAFAHWLQGPRLWRAGTFFSVRVPPGFIDSDMGRAILKRYRQRIWLWTAFVSGIFFVGSWKASIPSISLWLLPSWYGTLAGCIFAFSRATAETRVQANPMPAPSLRTAELFPEGESASWWVAILEWMGMVLPLAIPAAAACQLILHWRQMPGNSLRYSLMDITFAAGVGIVPAGMQFALRFHARSTDWNANPRASRKYRALLGFMRALVFSFVSLTLCFLATMPIGPVRTMSLYFWVTFRGYLILLLPLIGIRLWLARNVSKQSGDPMRDDCWKWGQFYANPEDPAWVVPSRFGAGLSYNYAQKAIWLTGVIVALITVVEMAQLYWFLMSSQGT